MRTILVVEDDPLNRLHLERFLRQNNLAVLCAVDGQEGVEMFEKHKPDLVLMDVMMPRMNGYQATRIIKAQLHNLDLVPVIFLTGLSDKQQLVECLECGGDDFIIKPFDLPILKARIQAWLRKVALSEHIANDREAVENVLLRMRQDNRFDPHKIRSLITPMERTTGDLLLSASNSHQVQHVMVGDFTGHGLSAAICGPLVSEIFYSMTQRDLPADEILTEINRKIYQKLPANMFLAATFMALDHKKKTLTLWNFWMPDILIFRAGELFKAISSDQMPLGIQENIDRITTTFKVVPGDKVYSCSDGIIETCNSDDEQFGLHNLQHSMMNIAKTDKPLDTIHQDLNTFRGNSDQLDDITLLELQC